MPKKQIYLLWVAWSRDPVIIYVLFIVHEKKKKNTKTEVTKHTSEDCVSKRFTVDRDKVKLPQYLMVNRGRSLSIFSPKCTPGDSAFAFPGWVDPASIHDLMTATLWLNAIAKNVKTGRGNNTIFTVHDVKKNKQEKEKM